MDINYKIPPNNIKFIIKKKGDLLSEDEPVKKKKKISKSFNKWKQNCQHLFDVSLTSQKLFIWLKSVFASALFLTIFSQSFYNLLYMHNLGWNRGHTFFRERERGVESEREKRHKHKMV